jgi:hypothetical protein
MFIYVTTARRLGAKRKRQRNRMGKSKEWCASGEVYEWHLDGQTVLIDKEFEPMTKIINWRLYQNKGKYGFYVMARIIYGKRDRMIIFFHRLVMGFSGKQIDHINRNTLDNRRSNLRLCDHVGNAVNRIYKNRTGFRGVKTASGCTNRWTASIRLSGKNVNIGSFPSKEIAAEAYDRLASQHHGEFAVLNFPEKIELYKAEAHLFPEWKQMVNSNPTLAEFEEWRKRRRE